MLSDQDSHAFDSFNPAIDGLLDCPHYTRPEVWRDIPVPTTLMSGNHGLIDQWRQQQRQVVTQNKRPDLLKPSTTKAKSKL